MASKRNIKRKSCTGKIKHTSQGAQINAMQLRRKGEKVHSYRCKYCWINGAKAYHVGHY